MVYAGGLDDVAYGWPVALMDRFEPAIRGERSFLRDAATMPNGERQFMRKCSICHALTAGRIAQGGADAFRTFRPPRGHGSGLPLFADLDGI